MRERQPAWWSTYFDEDYIRLYRTRLPPRRTRREVAGALRMLGLPAGARLLDLGCGWGRHAILFASAGLRVTGVDLSPILLRHAQRLAEEAEVEVEWVKSDVRELPWRERFDAVVSLFSSLGYFLSEAEDLRALNAARRALRPGGTFLLETMHRDHVVRAFAERDWWRGESRERVWVERDFDPVAGVLTERLWWSPQPPSVTGGGEKHFQMRIRTATEWNALLRRADLEPQRWYGGWHLKPFSHDSPRLIVQAVRPA